MRIGILGAGISGLTAAIAIERAGLGAVTLFEKEHHPGGLASSRIVDGFVFDLYGGHVFNTRDEQVRDFVFSFMPVEDWVHQERKARILYKGRVIDYPFEFALHQLDPEEGVECFKGYVGAGIGPEPDDYREWLAWRFGAPIAEKYMIPYNEKILSCDLDRLSTSWTKGKMPMPSVHEVEKAFRNRDSRERSMPHSFFYYPRRGGVQSLIDRMAKAVKGCIHYGVSVDHVEKKDGEWLVNGKHSFDVIISTMSLKPLIRALPAPSDVKRAALNLHDNAITFTLCVCEPVDISWLYIPDRRIPVHREVFMGAFSPENAPHGMSSVLLESTGRIAPEVQQREINARVPKAFHAGKIIASTFADSYIVYDRGCAPNLEVVNAYLDCEGIHRVGRFAEWRYDNMDVCIRRAFDLVERIFKDVHGGRKA